MKSLLFVCFVLVSLSAASHQISRPPNMLPGQYLRMILDMPARMSSAEIIAMSGVVPEMVGGWTEQNRDPRQMRQKLEECYEVTLKRMTAELDQLVVNAEIVKRQFATAYNYIDSYERQLQQARSLGIPSQGSFHQTYALAMQNPQFLQSHLQPFSGQMPTPVMQPQRSMSSPVTAMPLLLQQGGLTPTFMPSQPQPQPVSAAPVQKEAGDTLASAAQAPTPSPTENVWDLLVDPQTSPPVATVISETIAEPIVEPVTATLNEPIVGPITAALPTEPQDEPVVEPIRGEPQNEPIVEQVTASLPSEPQEEPAQPISYDNDAYLSDDRDLLPLNFSQAAAIDSEYESGSDLQSVTEDEAPNPPQSFYGLRTRNVPHQDDDNEFVELGGSSDDEKYWALVAKRRKARRQAAARKAGRNYKATSKRPLTPKRKMINTGGTNASNHILFRHFQNALP